MLKPLLLIFVLIATCGCQSAPPEETTASASPSRQPSANARRLVAFGDSLTEGLGVDPEQSYPAQLERRLQSEGLDWAVVNSGISGETSSGARSRLNWVLKSKPDAVLLEIGGNDSLRGIDPKITEENIEFLVTELHKQGVPVMLAGMKTLSNMGPDYTGPFEALYPAVAKRTKTPLIPFFLEGVGGVVALNQEDRIHPTEEGYTKIVDAIAPTVIGWLETLTAKKAAQSAAP